MSRPALTKTIRDKWCAKLRKGDLRKAYGVWSQKIVGGYCYCAVGILGPIMGIERPMSADLPEIPHSKQITDMNDADVPWPEIADWIEANVPVSDLPSSAEVPRE